MNQLQKIIGAIALAIGILLLVWGHNAAQSFNSQVENIFNGTPTNRAIYFYVGGLALIIYGLFQMLRPRK